MSTLFVRFRTFHSLQFEGFNCQPKIPFREIARLDFIIAGIMINIITDIVLTISKSWISFLRLNICMILADKKCFQIK